MIKYNVQILYILLSVASITNAMDIESAFCFDLDGYGERQAQKQAEIRSRVLQLPAEKKDINQVDPQLEDLPLHAVVSLDDHNDIVQQLLHADADVTLKNTEGDGILHKMVTSNESPTKNAALILEHAKKHKILQNIINTHNKEGNAPILQFALSSKMAAVLLAYGANPNLQVSDSSRWTPLHNAVYSDTDQKSSFEALKMLCAYGADPTLTNSQGEVPAAVARRKAEDYKNNLEADKENSDVSDDDELNEWRVQRINVYTKMADILDGWSATSSMKQLQKDPQSYLQFLLPELVEHTQEFLLTGEKMPPAFRKD